MITTDKLRYPIGFAPTKTDFSTSELNERLKTFAEIPSLLKDVVKDISRDDMHKTYRDGSWNVSQLIHHIADSHVNSYTRFKLAATEHIPIIKPYDENLWVNTPDCSIASIDETLDLIQIIHNRIVRLCQSFTTKDWKRQYFHPANKQLITLDAQLDHYVWHGLHHTEHIKIALAN